MNTVHLLLPHPVYDFGNDLAIVFYRSSVVYYFKELKKKMLALCAVNVLPDSRKAVLK